jgi:hypothetical protein
VSDSGRILNRGSIEIAHSMNIAPSPSATTRARWQNEGTFRVAPAIGPVLMDVAFTNTGDVVIEGVLNLGHLRANSRTNRHHRRDHVRS